MNAVLRWKNGRLETVDVLNPPPPDLIVVQMRGAVGGGVERQRVRFVKKGALLPSDGVIYDEDELWEKEDGECP